MTQDTASAFLFPVALNVRGRLCVVVGGGEVGYRRALALAEAGAEVLMVDPEVHSSVASALSEGILHHLAAPFHPDHLDGAFLVVAATGDSGVNGAVARAARERGVLLNQAAEGDGAPADAGDFATMATLRRGDLLLALTTGGAGPALTAKLRRELETQFGPEWSEYVSLLGELRTVAKERIPDARTRVSALRRLVEEEVVRTVLWEQGYEAARAEGEKCLSR